MSENSMSENISNFPDETTEIKKDLQRKIQKIGDIGTLKIICSILEDDVDTLIEIKTKGRLEEALKTRPQYRLLWANLGNDFKRSIGETAVAIGINKPSSVHNKPHENIPHYTEYDKNYINWLGKKLNFHSSELENMTVEEIDAIAHKYLEYAVEHVLSLLQSSIPVPEQRHFKSQYFDTIHNLREIPTVREYFTLYYEIEKEKKRYIQQNIGQDGIRNCEMAQYEIQRILALSYQYRELEQNHKYLHLEEDTNYIVEKFKELFWEQKMKHTSLVSDNPFYHYTDTKTVYWKKNPNDTYVCSSEPIDNAISDRFETITIQGRTRDFKGKEIIIPILHIAFRSNKDAMSTIDKLNRKQHLSFDEILDHKGIIFVLERFEDSHEHPAEMLIKILENTLGDLRSSWIEYPEFKKNMNDNNDTSSAYNVLKGVINMSRTPESLQKKAEELEKAGKVIGKLGGRAKKWTEMSVLKSFIEKTHKRSESLRYKIPLEVQIFDLDGYIKAELDEKSPAHHSRYKHFQQITSLPLYCPKEVYGEANLSRVINPVIHEKIKNDMLIKMKKKSSK